MVDVQRQIAATVVRESQIRPPVDVYLIAQRLGLEIIERPLGEEISGILRRDPESGSPAIYQILVNANHHPNRKRFTIAHEIAHYVLHRDLISDEIRDDALYRSNLSDEYERQANRMAANILMPAHLINELKHKGVTKSDELARAFGVSREAMAIRLGRTRQGWQPEPEKDADVERR